MCLPNAEEVKRLPSTAPPPKALPPPKVHVTNTSESLLSLLIKLHNKLVDGGQVYRPPDNDSHLHNATCVGDGPFYIRNLLDRTYFLSSSCRSEIDSLCDSSTEHKPAEMASGVDPSRAKYVLFFLNKISAS